MLDCEIKKELEKKGLIKIQTVPEYSAHNAHMLSLIHI